MILEAIVTTADRAGLVNIAPMGPWVDGPAVKALTLKPFRSSHTHANLRESGVAVVHVTDDVELIAASATGRVSATGLIEPLLGRWHKLIECCHWFAVEVESWEEDSLRPQAHCRIVHRGFQRPMFGLNRAKHAVLEGAILVTRLELLGKEDVERQMHALKPLVEKTGGPAEHRAWRQLESIVDG